MSELTDELDAVEHAIRNISATKFVEKEFEPDSVGAKQGFDVSMMSTEPTYERVSDIAARANAQAVLQHYSTSRFRSVIHLCRVHLGDKSGEETAGWLQELKMALYRNKKDPSSNYPQYTLPNSEVRLGAVEELGELFFRSNGIEPSLDLLVEAKEENGDEETRIAAENALIRAYNDHSFRNVRKEAGQALRYCGPRIFVHENKEKLLFAAAAITFLTYILTN